MSNLSRSGVSYNLTTSPFNSYRRGYTFYFSSMAHLLKFESQAQAKEEWLSDSMSNRFHFMVDCSILALFQLYLKIEGRGFYVIRESDGRVFDSIDSFSLKVS